MARHEIFPLSRRGFLIGMAGGAAAFGFPRTGALANDGGRTQRVRADHLVRH